jgi:ElaB/YqjD/DUF883 family membrane-anchored ribosome-binding protein
MLNTESSKLTNSVGATAGNSHDRSAEYADLRRELAMIASDVGAIIETRAAQAKQLATDAAEASLESTRETIREYPVSSIAVATVLGAVIAIALTSPPRRPSLAARIGHYVPEVTRADLNDMARQLQRSASHAVHGSSLSSAFERVVDSVSSIDPKSSLTPALEKAGAWLSSMRASIGGK